MSGTDPARQEHTDEEPMTLEEVIRRMERLDNPVEDGIRVIAYGLLAFAVGLALLGLLMIAMAWWGETGVCCGRY